MTLGLYSSLVAVILGARIAFSMTVVIVSAELAMALVTLGMSTSAEVSKTTPSEGRSRSGGARSSIRVAVG